MIHNSVVTVIAGTTTLMLLLGVLVTEVMVVVVNGIVVASTSVFVRSVSCNCVVCVGLMKEQLIGENLMFSLQLHESETLSDIHKQLEMSAKVILKTLFSS